MPQVPTYDSFQVAPTVNPEVRVVAPEYQDFASQQQAKMGAAMLGAGAVGSRIAADMQNTANAVRVDDAINQTKEAALALTYDKNDGFTSIKGQAALDRASGQPLAVEYKKKLSERISQLSEKLGNDSQRQAFALKANDLVTNFYGMATAHETKEFTEYFLAQIAARKANPTGDLLCDIANAQIDGEELTDDEQLGMLQQFLVAGNETTTNLISNMIRYLAENPSIQTHIRQHPELIEPFVEEMLRSEAPVGGLFRQAKVDVEIAGTTIPAGDHMWLVFASANRDECKFAEPDVVNPERANVKDHLAFGNGEHFCPGAGLARAEARIALQLVLEHLDDIRLTPDNDFPYGDSFVLRGLTSLKIIATPKN
jgi:hypothetical protein